VTSTRRLTLLLAVLLSSPPLAEAYLHFTTTLGDRSLTVKWVEMPVRWFLTDRAAPGVSVSQFQAVLSRAFATWQAVPTASITFRFAGLTGAEPFEDDNISVLGFQSEPGMDRVLGATSFLIDTLTGEIVEADIFFNSTFEWSTAQAGDPLRFDLESVAVHEIGHFIGLGHSALGETEIGSDGSRRVIASGSVMFPISFGRGNTLDRELQPDDVAGVSDLYPDGDFTSDTGVLRGRVARNGVGVNGAHVVAFNPETGALIAGFTLSSDGDFEIAGLTPGPHIIRVEPLDDASVESFFSIRRVVDVSFRVTFYDRLAIAPAGGAAEPIAVTVRPR
jgi:hypothetical protein